MLGFISNPLERDIYRQDKPKLREIFKEDTTKFLCMKNLNPLVKSKSLSYSKYHEKFDSLPFAYLGTLHNVAFFVIDVTYLDYTPDGEFIDSFKCIGFLSPEEASIMSQGRNILDFLTTNIFCTKCGKKMETSFDGYLKTCAEDKIRLYPRVNPVVIMLIQNRSGDKILMGANKKYGGKFLSCLSGFVDSCEPLEEAVMREAYEEAHAKIDRDSIQYFASQPWSFQQNNNLMIGFVATATSEDVVADDKEMSFVGWFDADQVKEMYDGKGKFLIPGHYAMANHWLQKMGKLE
jgi:NADH pyrophosphatase NudC (nudix superfamily)